MNGTIKRIVLTPLLLALPLALQAGKPGPPPPPPPPPDPAIAYIASGALMVMNADGSNKTVVLPRRTGVTYSDPNWSPDGRQLVFASNIEGPGVYVINREGTDMRLVATIDTTAVTVSGPVWSPVALGTNFKIAFADSNRDQGSTYDLYAVNIDGTERVNLTSSPELGEFNPTWDPLATRLAATAYPSGAVVNPTGDLVVYNLSFVDGILTVTGRSNLSASGPLDDFNYVRPDWGKTRDVIAFAAVANPGVDASNEIWVVDVADPMNPVRLTSTADAEENMPSWSPNDTQLVYRRNGAKNRVSLFVMNADGSNQHEIGFPERRETQARPDWRRNP